MDKKTMSLALDEYLTCRFCGSRTAGSIVVSSKSTCMACWKLGAQPEGPVEVFYSHVKKEGLWPHQSLKEAMEKWDDDQN